nr:MAG TPA: hypothetical protein [Caudoviricetes sp.]
MVSNLRASLLMGIKKHLIKGVLFFYLLLVQ